MKKQIVNLGKTLSKVEQREINGGTPPTHYTVICSAAGEGGHVNTIAAANILIRSCWAKGGFATIRDNYSDSSIA